MICSSLKARSRIHVLLIGPGALLNKVLCPSCQSFQLICLPWFCQAQSYFRQIELTHLSCVLQCFIVLVEINQEPKAHCESWLQKVGKPSLLSCSVSGTFVHSGNKQDGPRLGECVGTAPPQLPLSVYPCGNTCLSFGNPVASSTSLNGVATQLADVTLFPA